MRCRIKICCIASIDEAPIAIRHTDPETIVAQHDPFRLDLCSSVRSNGALDERRLAAFMRAVQS
jgi:hypothetical protein